MLRACMLLMKYETGDPPRPDRLAFYWNRKNLPHCVLNLGRSATAVWRILQDAGLPANPVANREMKKCLPHIKELLVSLGTLDPSIQGFARDVD